VQEREYAFPGLPVSLNPANQIVVVDAVKVWVVETISLGMFQETDEIVSTVPVTASVSQSNQFHS
jgi:hypothetical protein